MDCVRPVIMHVLQTLLYFIKLCKQNQIKSVCDNNFNEIMVECLLSSVINLQSKH